MVRNISAGRRRLDSRSARIGSRDAFESLLERADFAVLAPQVASLMHEAGNPFLDWFYEGAPKALAAVRRSLERSASELAASRVTVLTVGDRLTGMYVALGGTELSRCRKADTLAILAQAASPESRSSLLTRLASVRELFVPVEADEFYLSKIGVVADLRGLGHGRRLLEAYLAVGRRKGFERFRLDVSSDNDGAVALYRSRGFEADAERDVCGLHYLAMTLRAS